MMQFLLNPINGGVPGSIVELKIVYLDAEKVYLGLYVERMAGKWPVKSGWSLHGPGNYTQYQSGYVLQAIYPRPAFQVGGLGSLDRTPASPAADGSPPPTGSGDSTSE